MEPIHPWRWRLLTGWIVIVSILLIIGYRANQNRSIEAKQLAAKIAFQQRILAKQQQIIVDNQGRIQQSRTESCRRTYEGVRQIFKPIIPPPSQRTFQQQQNLNKFNATIDALKHQCPAQTTPKKAGP